MPTVAVVDLSLRGQGSSLLCSDGQVRLPAVTGPWRVPFIKKIACLSFLLIFLERERRGTFGNGIGC